MPEQQDNQQGMHYAEYEDNEERLLYMDLDLDPIQPPDGMQEYNAPIANSTTIFNNTVSEDTATQEISETVRTHGIGKQPAPIGGSSTSGTSRAPNPEGQHDEHCLRMDVDRGSATSVTSDINCTRPTSHSDFPELKLQLPLPADVIALLVSYDLAKKDLLEKPGLSLPPRADFVKQNITGEGMSGSTVLRPVHACTTCSMPLHVPVELNDASSQVANLPSAYDGPRLTPSACLNQPNGSVHELRSRPDVVFVQSTSSADETSAMSQPSTEHPDRKEGEGKRVPLGFDNPSSPPISIATGPQPTADAAIPINSSDTDLPSQVLESSRSPPAGDAGVENVSVQPMPSHPSSKGNDASTTKTQQTPAAGHAKGASYQQASARSAPTGARPQTVNKSEASLTVKGTPQSNESNEASEKVGQKESRNVSSAPSIAISPMQPKQSRGPNCAGKRKGPSSNASGRTRSTNNPTSSFAGLPLPPQRSANNTPRMNHPIPSKPRGSASPPRPSKDDTRATPMSNEPKKTGTARSRTVPKSASAASDGPISNTEATTVGQKRSRSPMPKVEDGSNSESGSLASERPSKILKEGQVGPKPQIEEEETRITDQLAVPDVLAEPQDSQGSRIRMQVDGIAAGPNVESTNGLESTFASHGSPPLLPESRTIPSEQSDVVAHISPPHTSVDLSHNRPPFDEASSNPNQSPCGSSEHKPTLESSQSNRAGVTPTSRSSNPNELAARKSTPPEPHTPANVRDSRGVREVLDENMQRRGRSFEHQPRQGDHWSPSPSRSPLVAMNSYRPSQSSELISRTIPEDYRAQYERASTPPRVRPFERRPRQGDHWSSSRSPPVAMNSYGPSQSSERVSRGTPEGYRTHYDRKSTPRHGSSFYVHSPAQRSHRRPRQRDLPAYRYSPYGDSAGLRSDNRREGMRSTSIRNDSNHRDGLQRSPCHSRGHNHDHSRRSPTPQSVTQPIVSRSSPRRATEDDRRYASQDRSPAHPSVGVANPEPVSLSSHGEVGHPPFGDSSNQRLPSSRHIDEGTINRRISEPETDEPAPSSFHRNASSSVAPSGQQGKDDQGSFSNETLHARDHIHPELIPESPPETSRTDHDQFVVDAVQPDHDQLVVDTVQPDHDRRSRALPTQPGLRSPRHGTNNVTQTPSQVASASVPIASAVTPKQPLLLPEERRTSEVVPTPHVTEQSQAIPPRQGGSPVLSQPRLNSLESGHDSSIGVQIGEEKHEPSDSFNPPGLELRHMHAIQSPTSSSPPPRDANATVEHPSATSPPRPSHRISISQHDAQAPCSTVEISALREEDGSMEHNPKEDVDLCDTVKASPALDATKTAVSSNPCSLAGRISQQPTIGSDANGTAQPSSPSTVEATAAIGSCGSRNALVSAPDFSGFDSMLVPRPTSHIEHENSVVPHLRDTAPSTALAALLERFGFDLRDQPIDPRPLLKRMDPPLVERLDLLHAPICTNTEGAEGMDEVEDKDDTILKTSLHGQHLISRS